MRKKILLILWISLLLSLAAFAQVKQQKLKRVNAMADVPKPLKIIDWKALAIDFDKKVYDFNATGDFWPMVWIDKTQKNFNQDVVGMYTAIGDARQGELKNKGMFHEALASMGAVLGGSLMGIDKSNQDGKNYVAMLKNYFNRENNWNIMMNNTAPEVALLGGGYGRDWWYDVYPNVLFYAVYDQYPNEKDFDWIAKTIAEQFVKADSVLNGNYNYSYFDYAQMKPMVNQICLQQDAAAGHAYVLYSAYKKFKDPRYLKGAISALKALEQNTINPTYELLMPFGTYVAAMLNVEQGTNFDVDKLLRWSFDGDAVCREGWGVLVGKWNGYDISGVVGSTVDHGGYGFLMNTFDMAWPMLPMLRYAPQYSDAIGKWMLNAVNASRFFYPEYLPEKHQTLLDKASVTKGVIAYEGFAKSSTLKGLYMDKKAPVAQGDGPKWVPGENPDVSQFSVYGSGHVGFFGATVETTSVEGVLKLDLTVTDFLKDQSYPTYLIYNPYNLVTTINYEVKNEQEVDLYDVISQQIVQTKVKKNSLLNLPKKQSLLLVEIPLGAKITYDGHKTLANDIVIDFNSKK